MEQEFYTCIGCGLIGGSFLKACKKKLHKQARLACIDLPEHLAEIRATGIADQVVCMDEAASVISSSRLILLAVPVEVTESILRKIEPHLRPGTIVTDVGSTKEQIMQMAHKHMPEGVQFIGGHPIAGLEKVGISASHHSLFKQKPYILCPYPDTKPENLLFLIELIEKLGANPITVEASEQDQIMAMVSHLPQLLAIAMVRASAKHDKTHGLLDRVVGKGFMDFTRIAASDYDMWRGIIGTNADAIKKALHLFNKSFEEIQESISNNTLEELWVETANYRKKLNKDGFSASNLIEYRGLIDDIDVQIISLLKLRNNAVQKIGEYKKRWSIEILDKKREDELLSDRETIATLAGVQPELVKELFGVIMKYSKKNQRKN